MTKQALEHKLLGSPWRHESTNSIGTCPWGMRSNPASPLDSLHGSVASVSARIAEYKYQQ